jgi:hypothetical protein
LECGGSTPLSFFALALECGGSTPLSFFARRNMIYRTALTLAVLLASPLAGRSEHATIDLRLIRPTGDARTSNVEANANVDVEPPAGGFSPRPLIKVKAEEPLILQFILVNNYPHGVHKDVVVRYYVVRQEKVRQKRVPDLSKGTVTEGRFKMNFKPKCRVGARVSFSIKDKGIYLLRVQTGNTNSDHEHFSAIDVQVE